MTPKHTPGPWDILKTERTEANKDAWDEAYWQRYLSWAGGIMTGDAISATSAPGACRPTPAPWIQFAMNGGGIAVEIENRPDGGRKRIATVGIEFSPNSADSCSRWHADEVDEANARLIAAAPDLLAALELCDETIMDAAAHSFDAEHKARVCRAANAARAAIAKATGNEVKP